MITEVGFCIAVCCFHHSVSSKTSQKLTEKKSSMEQEDTSHEGSSKHIKQVMLVMIKSVVVHGMEMLQDAQAMHLHVLLLTVGVKAKI